MSARPAQTPHPFDYPGDERGVLCVHGFTGTPFDMNYLGQKLAARGFTVVGPVLAGHGKRPEDLNSTDWAQWTSGIDGELDALQKRCKKVAVVGLSLGGLITLHLARRRGSELSAIGVLAAPMWLPAYARVLIPLLARAGRWHRLFTQFPKPSGGPDVRDREMRAQSPTMGSFPTSALLSLLEFTRVVRADVGAVTVPAFLAHSRQDHTAPFAGFQELQRRIGSTDTQALTLKRSYHVITIDVEREQLADSLGDFLEQRMPS